MFNKFIGNFRRTPQMLAHINDALAASSNTDHAEVREAVDQRGCVLSNMVAVWGDDHFKVRNFNRWLETHTAPDVTPTMGLL